MTRLEFDRGDEDGENEGVGTDEREADAERGATRGERGEDNGGAELVAASVWFEKVVLLLLLVPFAARGEEEGVSDEEAVDN